jgi:hypothetical protein
MKKVICFLKSLKDPCKLCLVKAACYQGQDCPSWINHGKAKRDLKRFAENAGAISLVIFAMFGVIFVFVLIFLGAISFHEIIFR